MLFSCWTVEASQGPLHLHVRFPYSTSGIETLTRSVVLTSGSVPHACMASPFTCMTQSAESGAAMAAIAASMPSPELAEAPMNSLKGMCSKGMLSTTFSTMAAQQQTTACVQATAGPPGPPHGVKAVCGKRNQMEDAFQVQTNFFDLPGASYMDVVANKLPPRLNEIEAILTSSVASSRSGSLTNSASPGSPSSFDSYSSDMLHFYGV